MKNLINLRALFKEIYPGKLAIVINKAYIICMFANRNRCWTPYIRKHLFQGNSGYTSRHGIWQLMALGKLTRVTYIRIYFWQMRKFVFPNILLHHKGRRMS
jgi:hypothetical protein